MAQILDLFDAHKNLKITLQSGAPAGSGLGGSSAMGVTLYKALCQYFGKELDIDFAVKQVKAQEGRILNQGIPGYQDYYPALKGGVLAILPKPGKLEIQQLFSEELKSYLESHVTLVYSGISRDSGINNWDVYKSFFDKDATVLTGMSEIAKLSFQAYKAILNKDYALLIELIGKEGDARKELAPNIVPEPIVQLSKKLDQTGVKMCGAGGGGCFLLTHGPNQKEQVNRLVEQSQMKVLDFAVEGPLE